MCATSRPQSAQGVGVRVRVRVRVRLRLRIRVGVRARVSRGAHGGSIVWGVVTGSRRVVALGLRVVR